LLYATTTGLATVKEVRLNWTVNESLQVTSGNWSNSTTIGFNCTGSTVNTTDYVDNVTLVVWNLTNGIPVVYLNTTNTTRGANGSTVVRNFSTTIPNSLGLNWSFNCFITDNASSTSLNTTGNVTFGVDADAPVVTATSPANNYEWVTNTTVEFNFTAFDRSSDIENCSLWIHGVKNATNTSYHDEHVNGTFKVTLNSSQMLRPIQWYVKCAENLTNRVGTSSDMFLYTTREDSSEDSGSSPDSGSSNDIGDVDDFGTAGTKKEISTGKTVVFDYSGTSHSLKLNSIVDDDTAKITVSSTPITTSIDVGKTKNFDLDDDGSNDLSITLNNIDGSKAEFTFKAYSTPSEVTTTDDTTESEEVEDTAPVRESPDDVEETSGSSTTWIVIAAIVLVAIVAYVIITKKKK